MKKTNKWLVLKKILHIPIFMILSCLIILSLARVPEIDAREIKNLSLEEKIGLTLANCLNDARRYRPSDIMRGKTTLMVANKKVTSSLGLTLFPKMGVFTRRILKPTSRFKGVGYFKIATPQYYRSKLKKDSGWDSIGHYPIPQISKAIALPKGIKAIVRYKDVQSTAEKYTEVQTSFITKEPYNLVFTVSMRRPFKEDRTIGREMILKHFGRFIFVAQVHQLISGAHIKTNFSGVDPPAILEWEKLWDDFSVNELNSLSNFKFGNFSSISRQPRITQKHPYVSYACFTHPSTEQIADGKVVYSRWKMVALYIFESEQKAHTNFTNWTTDSSWIWKFNPIKEAFKGNPKLLEHMKEDFARGDLGRDDLDVWSAKKIIKVAAKNPGMHRKEAGSIELSLERYKTVIMITGGWVNARTKPYIDKAPVSVPLKALSIKGTKGLHELARRIVDKRVRILRVKIEDIRPETDIIDFDLLAPFDINVDIEEWVYDSKSREYKWEEPKDRPVYISLRMYKYGKLKPLKRAYAELVDAYKGERGALPLRFEGPVVFSRGGVPPGYKTDDQGRVRISLKESTWFQKGGKRKEISIDIHKLAELISETYRKLPPLPPEKGPEREAPVGATIEAVAYYGLTWEPVDLSKDAKQIRYSHVAEVAEVTTSSRKYKSKLVCKEDSGKGKASRKFQVKDGLKLMPNDIIFFGSGDGIMIRYPFLEQEWFVQGYEKGLGKDKIAFITIYPLATNWPRLNAWYESSKTSVKGMPSVMVITTGVIVYGIMTRGPRTADRELVGKKVLLITCAAAAATQIAQNWLDEAFGKAYDFIRDRLYPPKIKWKLIRIKPGGTVVAIRTGESEYQLYVIEGEAAISLAGGNEVVLKEGQMSTLDETGRFSTPQSAPPLSLPPAVKAAMANIRHSSSIEPAQKDKVQPVGVTPAQAPSASVWLVKKKSPHDFIGYHEKLRGNGSPDSLFHFKITGPGQKITALNIRNVNGQFSAWDTIPDNSRWLLAVVQGDKVLNQSDGRIEISLGHGEHILKLLVQDNNSIAAGKTEYALTVTFEDGSHKVFPIRLEGAQRAEPEERQRPE